VPVALVVLLLDITLIYHASRTGRLQPWAFIILMVPLIGSLVYICVELIPEWLSGPGAQQARRRVANKLDPEKQYRELSDRLAVSDTIANRAALAAECLNIARFDEAERHYDHILKLPMGGEPAYALGKANAQFSRNRSADAIVTKLQTAFSSIQDAFVIAIEPPSVRGMGDAGGFQLEIEDRKNVGLNALQVATDSITASAPSKIAVATSETSARVGTAASIIDSSICVATTTGLPRRRAALTISFCRMGTVSSANSTPRSPRATISPSAASIISSM